MTAILEPPVLTTTIPTPRRAVQTGHEDQLPKLSPSQLRAEQQRTLDAPRRRYSLAARGLFLVMDLLYGRKRTMRKFRVLEIVARVPYQTWETVTYKKITKGHRDPFHIRRLWERMLNFRAQADNEQWHLMILNEQVDMTVGHGSRLWYDALPRVIAWSYWHFAWLLYAIKPTWSHRLNADFEDHAEHEYALLVAENPQFEFTRYETEICHGYGDFASLADLFRQIGHDERLHKQESEQHL